MRRAHCLTIASIVSCSSLPVAAEFHIRAVVHGQQVVQSVSERVVRFMAVLASESPGQRVGIQHKEVELTYFFMIIHRNAFPIVWDSS